MISIGILNSHNFKNIGIENSLNLLKEKLNMHHFNSLDEVKNNQAFNLDFLLCHPDAVGDVLSIAIDLPNLKKILTITDDTSKEEDSEEVVYLQKQKAISALLELLDEHLKESYDELNLIPVRIKCIVRPSYIFPFYKMVKLKSQVLIEANSEISSQIKSSWGGPDDYVYIHADYFELFLESLEESEIPAIDLMESLQDFILDFGFSSKNIEQTVKIQNKLQSIFSKSMVKNHLATYFKREGSFLYNHSFLTSIVCLTVGEKLTWMDEDNNSKLVMASMLHDILHVNDELAISENLATISTKVMKDKTKQSTFGHATELANSLEKIREIDSDVINIIRLHHGYQGENSYPRKLSPNEISLPFALFIISHEFTIHMYKEVFHVDRIPDILERMNKVYNQGTFKKIFPVFESVIRENYKLTNN